MSTTNKNSHNLEAGRDMDYAVAGIKDYNFVDFTVPHYSTMDTVALPLLDNLRKMYFSTIIYLHDYDNKVTIVGEKRSGHNEPPEVDTVYGETLAEAICRGIIAARDE